LEGKIKFLIVAHGEDEIDLGDTQPDPEIDIDDSKAARGTRGVRALLFEASKAKKVICADYGRTATYRFSALEIAESDQCNRGNRTEPARFWNSRVKPWVHHTPIGPE